MKWLSSAPSNIALIKYMGKMGSGKNVSTNASLSYTLNHLLSHVELELISGTDDSATDRWEPLIKDGQAPIQLSDSGKSRFINHLQFLKNEWGCTQNFVIRSSNSFPSDCGLASSASSFAALTMCAYQAIRDLKKDSTALDLTIEQVADFSRQGSGSSCRSFFSPWGLWDERGVRSVEALPYQNLLHQVVIANDAVKKVSSSEAHKRVNTSLLAPTRTQRAEKRLEDLISGMKDNNWKECFEIIWAEFWDMHALFETSQPAFGYMSGGSLTVLRYVNEIWDKEGDGPWVTMDAGPNIHLLYRPDQKNLAAKIESELAKSYKIFSTN